MTTPSPNPVESLRALPEDIRYWVQTVVPCQHWLGNSQIGRICRFEHRDLADNICEKLNRRPASAPDAELFQRKYVVLANATPTEFCRWHNWCVDHPGKTMDDAIIEVLNQRAILAKHSTAAEEGHDIGN